MTNIQLEQAWMNELRRRATEAVDVLVAAGANRETLQPGQVGVEMGDGLRDLVMVAQTSEFAGYEQTIEQVIRQILGDPQGRKFN
jgi:hypothetical protein